MIAAETTEELDKRIEAAVPFSDEQRDLMRRRYIRTFEEWCDREEREEGLAIYRLKVSQSIVDMKTARSETASRHS